MQGGAAAPAAVKERGGAELLSLAANRDASGGWLAGQ